MAQVQADTKYVYNEKGRIKTQGIVIQKKLFTAQAANGSSGHLDFRGVKKGSCQILGTFVADIDIEGSNDNGVTFAKIGSTLNAPIIVDIPTYCDFIRLTMTNFVSGTTDGHVSGVTD